MGDLKVWHFGGLNRKCIVTKIVELIQSSRSKFDKEVSQSIVFCRIKITFDLNSDLISSFIILRGGGTLELF